MTTAIDARAADQCSFDYAFLPVGDLRVETTPDPKSGKPVVTAVLVQDEPLIPTERFWTSCFARYGFNSAFFKYFDHAEVFGRISEREAKDKMRVCIERDANGKGTLLGVSNPTKPIVVYDELMDTLGRYGGRDLQYHNGIVESSHVPRSGHNVFQVGGDDFVNRFLLATPIDGYGAPNIYLSLLRQLCQNGVVGYAKLFRSSLALGKGDDDVTPSLTRALDGFNNDEGYAAIRHRAEAAQNSWLSVDEALKLYDVLVKLHSKKTIEDMGGMTPEGAKYVQKLLQVSDPDADNGFGSPVIAAYHAMTGDTSKIYGLANLDALSVKRKKTLPVKCRVMDAINLATEVATHYCTPEGGRRLQAWVGGLIAEEYDLEGTCDRFAEFKDFAVDAKSMAGISDGAIKGRKGTADHKGLGDASVIEDAASAA